jgi:hypothetical protein
LIDRQINAGGKGRKFLCLPGGRLIDINVAIASATNIASTTSVEFF